MQIDMTRRIGAELLGTFWLVFGGCGAAVLAGNAGEGLGIGILGVSFAFGLTVVTGAYALGHISGGHFNPAVTIGQVVARRFPPKDALPYILAQCIGAVLAAALLYLVVNGRTGFEADGNFLAANGWGTEALGANYPNFNLLSALVIETVLTFVFLMVILGATDARAHPALAGLGIGLCLTLIHLISIPVTNTSVNPARSLGPALFVGGDAITQLWLFIVAPIAGAIAAGVVYPLVFGEAPGDTSAA